MPSLMFNSPYASMGGYGSLGSGGYGMQDDYLNVNPMNSSPLLTAPNPAAPLYQVPGANDLIAPQAEAAQGGFFDNILGTPGKPGWGGTAVGLLSGIGQAYMGMKQYGLAKETLANNKEQFAKNYAAQKQTTNTAMEDRQRARVAANPGAYESVGSYIGRNGIK